MDGLKLKPVSRIAYSKHKDLLTDLTFYVDMNEFKFLHFIKCQTSKLEWILGTQYLFNLGRGGAGLRNRERACLVIQQSEVDSAQSQSI